MKHASIASALLLAALPLAAAADMYSWKDPQSGRTRMSNSPPQWLREGLAGPRVEVIRENKVIDVGTAFAKPQEPAQMSARQRAMARLPSAEAEAAAADLAAAAAEAAAEAAEAAEEKP